MSLLLSAWRQSEVRLPLINGKTCNGNDHLYTSVEMPSLHAIVGLKKCIVIILD
jgi:hypothetical protein